MTIVSEIIHDAYRESNLIAIGMSPSAAQEEEALRLLRRIVEGVYGTKEGDELEDLPIGRNGIDRPSGFPWYDPTPNIPQFFIPQNVNPMPQDGERFCVLDKSDNLNANPLTIDANGRTIDGEASAVFDVNGTNTEYMYRADLGDWTVLSPIDSMTVFPFPKKFDDMFVTLLALRLNSRNEATLSPESLAALKDSMNRFKAKYHQTRMINSELGLLRTPGNGRRRWRAFNGSNEFNSGYPYLGYGGYVW